MCNKDCWNCDLDGCPYTLEESNRIDKAIIRENRIFRGFNGNRYKKYASTDKGYAVKMKAKQKYEKKNPGKVALWSFKSRMRREQGRNPSEEECEQFMIRWKVRNEN